MCDYLRRCDRCKEAIVLRLPGELIMYNGLPDGVSEKLDDLMEEHLLFCGNKMIVPEDQVLIVNFYREVRKSHRRKKNAKT